MLRIRHRWDSLFYSCSFDWESLNWQKIFVELDSLVLLISRTLEDINGKAKKIPIIERQKFNSFSCKKKKRKWKITSRSWFLTPCESPSWSVRFVIEITFQNCDLVSFPSPHSWASAGITFQNTCEPKFQQFLASKKLCIFFSFFCFSPLISGSFASV
jgi:hypothetical protein